LQLKQRCSQQICVLHAIFCPRYPRAFFRSTMLHPAERGAKWQRLCNLARRLYPAGVTARLKYLSIHIFAPSVSHYTEKSSLFSSCYSKTPRSELKSRTRRPNVFLGGLNAGESGEAAQWRHEDTEKVRKEELERTDVCVRIRTRRYTGEDPNERRSGKARERRRCYCARIHWRSAETSIRLYINDKRPQNTETKKMRRRENSLSETP
jgi:hypothetical protein